MDCSVKTTLLPGLSQVNFTETYEIQIYILTSALWRPKNLYWILLEDWESLLRVASWEASLLFISIPALKPYILLLYHCTFCRRAPIFSMLLTLTEKAPSGLQSLQGWCVGRKLLHQHAESSMSIQLSCSEVNVSPNSLQVNYKSSRMIALGTLSCPAWQAQRNNTWYF